MLKYQAQCVTTLQDDGGSSPTCAYSVIDGMIDGVIDGNNWLPT